MIWPDKAFLAAYFLVFIILQCWWQSVLFKRNMKISHFWHAVYYLLTALAMIRFFDPWWKVLVIAAVERLALFDFTLSLFRGKSLFYNAGKNAGSLIDRWENHLSETWVKVLKMVYVAIFISVLIYL